MYDISNAKEKAKQQKKMEKLMETNIVYGVPNGKSYNMIGFRGKPKFADMYLTPRGTAAIAELVSKVKRELKKGEKIFNTNIKI